LKIVEIKVLFLTVYVETSFSGKKASLKNKILIYAKFYSYSWNKWTIYESFVAM